MLCGVGLLVAVTLLNLAFDEGETELVVIDWECIGLLVTGCVR